jgi:hypothetical protein
MGKVRETNSKHWHTAELNISILKLFNVDKVKKPPMPSMVFRAHNQQIATHSEHALAFRAQDHQIATILLIANQVREQAFFEH